jgi:methylated-DNA-protein-cysteine methyltransferase-like protein
MASKALFEKVYSVVRRVPQGKVTSYGAIGKATGLNPRHIGHILHFNPDPHFTPCHRVVHSDGTLPDGYAFGGKNVQKELLEKEGVVFEENGKISKICFIKA